MTGGGATVTVRVVAIVAFLTLQRFIHSITTGVGADARRGRGAGIAGLNVTDRRTSITIRVIAIVALLAY
jgi:hypothetical protein